MVVKRLSPAFHPRISFSLIALPLPFIAWPSFQIFITVGFISRFGEQKYKKVVFWRAQQIPKNSCQYLGGQKCKEWLFSLWCICWKASFGCSGLGVRSAGSGGVPVFPRVLVVACPPVGEGGLDQWCYLLTIYVAQGPYRSSAQATPLFLHQANIPSPPQNQKKERNRIYEANIEKSWKHLL